MNKLIEGEAIDTINTWFKWAETMVAAEKEIGTSAVLSAKMFKLRDVMLGSESIGAKKYQSMKYEWIFLKNRVLSWKLIADWEMNRIWELMGKAYYNAEGAREKFNEMGEDFKKNTTVTKNFATMRRFMLQWASKDNITMIMDEDGGRKNIRVIYRLNRDMKNAKDIYLYYSE